jgi:hypothetical protein
LVDDATPYDVVPKSLFCSDMLDMCTNQNGALQSPFGVCIQNATIAFGNLTVAACPTDSVFEVDCTGALAAPIPAASAPHSEYVAHLAQQRADAQILHAERVRAGRDALPPTSLELTPNAAKPEPPKPPDPAMVAADEEGLRQHQAAVAARARAKGPTIIGQPLAEIQDNLRIAARKAQAEKARIEAENAAMQAVADRISEQRATAQRQAAALLKAAGHSVKEV